jgi:KipI family sensor histidine kinase inhibitor
MSDDRSVIRVEPFGDEAVLITLGDTVDVVINERVHRLASMLDRGTAHDLPIGRPVPAYASVLVPYDVSKLGVDEAVRELAALARRIDRRPVTRADEPVTPLVEVPTHYGGADGEDLPLVAERLGRSEREIAELHASIEYRVFMLGFVPGFAYLGTLPESLAMPRRASPRERVPAGSIGIAERQTAVYAVESPGGWHLIGRTELPIWDPRRQPPALLTAGARVRFVPVRSG